MAEPAERMRAMGEHRRPKGLCELGLLIPDSRETTVRLRVARQVARLDRRVEKEVLVWSEAVSEFDAPAAPAPGAVR